MTDGAGRCSSSLPPPRALPTRDPGDLAVVITSSFWAVEGSPVREVSPKSLGSALFDLRGGRKEPITGATNPLENQMMVGGSRYALRPAKSER